MASEQEKRQELTEVYKELDRSGLIFLASGNISVRHGDGMLISPTGASADKIAPEHFIFCNFDGTCPEGGKPSSEWSMHAAIYDSAPATQAVVHTHSDNCVAVSCTNKPLPPFHYMIAAFGGSNVKCTPYVTYGSPELGRAAVEALQGRNSCLLGNHGMISHGSSLRKTFNLALRLEILCRQYIQARQAGEVVMMQPHEIDIAIDRYKTYQIA